MRSAPIRAATVRERSSRKMYDEAMRRALLVALLWIPTPLAACQCLLTLSACNEVALADRVFIGTVESVEPSFLNRWNPSKSPSLPLRQQLAGMDLPDYYKRRLAA